MTQHWRTERTCLRGGHGRSAGLAGWLAEHLGSGLPCCSGMRYPYLYLETRLRSG